MFRTVPLSTIRSPVLYTQQWYMSYRLCWLLACGIRAHVPLNVKLVNAKQTKETYRYRNTKEKLYKTNAAIWYNKICREKQQAPNYMYISIKINGKNSQCQKTVKAAFHYQLHPDRSSRQPTELAWQIPIACLQCWDTSDDGQWTCPKHVEYFMK